MIGNFKQVVKTGDLRIHPLVAKLVDAEMLQKLGASERAMAEGADTAKSGGRYDG